MQVNTPLVAMDVMEGVARLDNTLIGWAGLLLESHDWPGWLELSQVPFSLFFPISSLLQSPFGSADRHGDRI